MDEMLMFNVGCPIWNGEDIYWKSPLKARLKAFV